mmetsp:Transcript_9208/g.33743  ORF Transcript_9208/g.33743 Transcript_9208/m.33743 type:complete len:686 (-) Transcript_9208:1416-3473(-)
MAQEQPPPPSPKANSNRGTTGTSGVGNINNKCSLEEIQAAHSMATGSSTILKSATEEDAPKEKTAAVQSVKDVARLSRNSSGAPAELQESLEQIDEMRPLSTVSRTASKNSSRKSAGSSTDDEEPTIPEPGTYSGHGPMSIRNAANVAGTTLGIQTRARGPASIAQAQPSTGTSLTASKGGPPANLSAQALRALHRINKRSEAYATFFSLTPQEAGEFVDDFVCALQKRILLQGRMYLFEHYLCFHCNIFGYTKKKRIPLTKVKDIKKARTVGFIPNAIIVTWDRERDGSTDTVSEFFTSFIFRDFVYEKLAYVLSKSAADDGEVVAPKNMNASMLGSLVEGGEEGVLDGDDDGMGSEEHNAMASERELDGSDDNAGVERMDTMRERLDVAAPKKPDGMDTLLKDTLPIGAKAFFRRFLGETRDFESYFRKVHGHFDVKLGSWDDCKDFGFARQMDYKVKNQQALGPKETACHQTQRFCNYKDRAVYETSQVHSGIPFADAFRIESRWDIVPIDPNKCELEVSTAVRFTKRTVWKSVIQYRSMEECKESYQLWHRLAMQELEKDPEPGAAEDDEAFVAPAPKRRSMPEAEAPATTVVEPDTNTGNKMETAVTAPSSEFSFSSLEVSNGWLLLLVMMVFLCTWAMLGWMYLYVASLKADIDAIMTTINGQLDTSAATIEGPAREEL